MNLFINRKEELKFLNQRYQDPKAQFIVIYGRRRIGKSELVKEFSKDKPSIYFLTTRTTTHQHLKKFLARIASHFAEFPPEIDSWEQAFIYLAQKIGRKKLVLIIDEFPYLIESNKEIPSLFQLFWDEHLKNKNIFLILLGSSISMMETEVLGKKSPLYGRRTGQIRLAPFRFKDILKFYPRAAIEKIIEFYAVVGNIPLYLWEFEQNKTLLENIKEKIIAKKELLNEEAEFLLKEELRDPATYQAILEAIAVCTKATEISQKAGLELHNLDKYLKVLMRLDLIYKETPVTIKQPSSRKSRYYIKDNFLDFWYKFCFPQLSLIEENPKYLIHKIIKPALNSHVGRKFEKVCEEILWELNRKHQLPFVFTKIGKQWGKIPRAEKGRNTYEIDLCTLNEKTHDIFFVECKWQNQVDPQKILAELKEKAQYVDWYNSHRKEYFCLFAKSFQKPISEKNVYLFDLKKIDKLF